MNYNINPHIARYMEMVENGEIRACEEQHLLAAYIRRCFESEPIYTDDEQLENYLGLVKYFPFERLYEWEEFLIALHDCTYWEDGRPRWPNLFCLIGRGAGKDGMIGFESMCLVSPYNGIKNYDVDICANNEDQAMRPVKDLLEVMDSPKNRKRLKQFFYWTKEEIKSLKTRSVIKGHTNSPKGKDGLRSGAVVFNEIHQYENYANIDVFTTGLGKKKHPRRSYYTTNGNIREGPLDDLLETSEGILRGGEPDNGLLPFICKLNCKEDVDDPENWQMANPSLPYKPELWEEIKNEYAEWKKNPAQLPAFLTKRMNIPQSMQELAVTDWENISATNRPLPNLAGWSCTVGIDYARITDFASVNLHFRSGAIRYDINHSWLCLQSKDLGRLKIPWKEWAEKGQLTIVDNVEINPELLTEYIANMGQKYNILKLALDSYRYALLANYLRKIGFDATDYKNVKLIQPKDIMKVVPVIDSVFVNQNFIWGDCPPLRWATNNTKLIQRGKQEGSDTGNYYYAKIEAKSRKTDPFMALVASVVIEEELGDGESLEVPEFGVFVY